LIKEAEGKEVNGNSIKSGAKGADIGSHLGKCRARKENGRDRKDKSI
jgi:hypothetical protein